MNKLIFFGIFLFTLFSNKLYCQEVAGERIFYSSYRPEGWDILLSKDGGLSFQPFAEHPALDYDASLSPDGKWVVFTSERIGNPKLFVSPVDGSEEPRLLIESESMQDQLSFSPDGKWIAFVSTHQGNADIYLLPFQPHATLSLDAALNLTNHPGGDFRPAFSPDGSKVAFSSDRDHPITRHKQLVFAMHRKGNIYLTDLQGSKPTRLTTTNGWDGSPSWSASGQEIYFYSEREQTGKFRIYSMRADGTDQRALTPEGIQAVSPVPLTRNTLAFTSWHKTAKGAPAFRLLRWHQKTGQIDTLTYGEANLFNLQATQEGKTLVCHGNMEPAERPENIGGFNGQLLVGGVPKTKQLADRTTELYGVRRAFVAPANPAASEVVFAHTAIESPLDVLTGWGYAFLFIPVFLVGMFIFGIVRSILERSKVKPWRYLLFSLGSLFLALLVIAVLVYPFAFLSKPLASVRGYIFVGFVLSTGVLWLTFRSYRKAYLAGKSRWRVRKLMVLNLAIASLGILYIALLLNRFVYVPVDFYEVNYADNSMKHLFRLEEVGHYHPANTLILDLKYTPDGDAFLFSIGNFRADPSNQGDIWRVDRQTLKKTKLTNSDFNDGFGEYSKDGKQMVFRSGRTGFFDIYLQDGDTLLNLTKDEARDNFPAISPDGKSIAYCSDKEGTLIEQRTKTVDIYLINRNDDGSWSQPRRITSGEGQEAHPHFSPDNEWLVYTSEEGGINDEQPLVQNYMFNPQMYGEIYAVNLWDSTKIRITHNKWEDGAPLWLPPLKDTFTAAVD